MTMVKNENDSSYLTLLNYLNQEEKDLKSCFINLKPEFMNWLEKEIKNPTKVKIVDLIQGGMFGYYLTLKCSINNEVFYIFLDDKNIFSPDLCDVTCFKFKDTMLEKVKFYTWIGMLYTNKIGELLYPGSNLENYFHLIKVCENLVSEMEKEMKKETGKIIEGGIIK